MGKNNTKMTDDYIKQKTEENGYEFISLERTKDNKGRGIINITVKCPNGHITTKRWHHIRDKKGCKECSNNKKLTTEEVKNHIESIGYKLLSEEYENNHTHILIQCDKGHKYDTSYKVFKKGFRCPHCSKKAKYSYKEVRSIIENEGYKLLSTEYSNANEYIEVQCPKNHKSYKVRFSDFNNNNRRCPSCNESKGERKISEILDSMKIKYEKQYKFDDCKSVKKLPFDFYLLDYNILIEFDGIGHYEIVNWNGNKEIAFDSFVGGIIRDTIKNEYCKKNNIKLIRIPYWDYDNIENILKENLK